MVPGDGRSPSKRRVQGEDGEGWSGQRTRYTRNVSFGTSRVLSVSKDVWVSSWKFQLSLDACLVLADLMMLLEALTNRVHDDRGFEEVLPKTLDGPKDGTSFKFEDGLVLLVWKGSTTKEGHGADRAIGLLLFEGSTDAIAASIAR